MLRSIRTATAATFAVVGILSATAATTALAAVKATTLPVLTQQDPGPAPKPCCRGEELPQGE